MPQKEGETDYKYEDYAADMAYHRLPTTTDLVNQKMKLTLDSGAVFDLEFTKPNEVNWQSGSESGTDWYEAIEVAPNTYYIDMTFADTPRECRTFFVNTETRRVLSVHTVMREGDVGKEPRAVQDFQPGVLGDPNVPADGLEAGADTRSDRAQGPLYLQSESMFRAYLSQRGTLCLALHRRTAEGGVGR